MGFVYFKDVDGNHTIVNDKHIVFVDFKDGEIEVRMTNGFSAHVEGEMFSAEDFELAFQDIKLWLNNKSE